ncbi:hypothetical protein HOH30_03440, partial [Candidatus Woesearchaeota archaeon]|nr:hypothetical protein [Candidatus Woesearchaeota archaeon]
FNFALESNVRNNFPAEPDQILTSAPQPLSSLACQKEHWDTEMLRTIVIDSFTKEPLEMVRLGFSIPNQADCDVGFTNDNGEAQSTLPVTYGGVVNFIKEDYLTNFYPIDTYEYQENPGIIGYALGEPENVIPLHKVVSVPVSVKKISLEKCIDDNCFFADSLFAPDPVISYRPEALGENHGWVLTSSKKNLRDTETATIFLERISDTVPGVFNSPFQAAIAVSGPETQEVELVPGVYKVTGTAVLNEPIVIPEERRCIEIEIIPGIWEESECFTIDEITFDAFVTSQIEWNTKDTYITITPEQLYGSQGITLYLPVQEMRNVPEEEHVRVMEDLNVMAELSNLTRQLKTRRMLHPTFT